MLVTSFPFLFNLRLAIRTNMTVFEAWGENKKSPGQYHGTESQLLSFRIVDLTLAMRRGQITAGSSD